MIIHQEMNSSHVRESEISWKPGDILKQPAKNLRYKLSTLTCQSNYYPDLF